MAQGNNGAELRRANFRRCILCTWPNYTGLGFNLQNASARPFIIRTIESNSPAAAAGLRILDVVLAVNNQDVSNAEYSTVTQEIKNARDNHNRIDLLVIETRFYEQLKLRGIVFDPQHATIIETPKTMPKDYTNFPKYTPRTCDITLNKNEESFGFEVVNGPDDRGAYIQNIHLNSPASRTTLRKCDRILEIDGKYVNNDASKTILEKLGKAKKKHSVKLYVVDTNTYKYFQDNEIPLPSKEFVRTPFSRQLPSTTGAYINIGEVSNVEPQNSDMESSNQDNIRLYTLARAHAAETYGIELNYHRREQYHSLKFSQPREAILGPIEPDNHIIEVNGQNIERMSDADIQQRIRAIKYPQPLELLVADNATYERYKKQGKTIHNGLPSVKRIPNSTNQTRSDSMISAGQQHASTITSASSTRQRNASTTVIPNLAIRVPIGAINSSHRNIQRYELRRSPHFNGYGFSLAPDTIGSRLHKINKVASNSPAEQQGIKAGDYIISVNGENVEKMSEAQFKNFLHASINNPTQHGKPLILEILHEDSSHLSNLPASNFPRRSVSHASTISSQQQNARFNVPNQQNANENIQQSNPRQTISSEIIGSNPIIPQQNHSTPARIKSDITMSPRTPPISNRQIPIRDKSSPNSKTSSPIIPYENQNPITSPKSTNNDHLSVHQQYPPTTTYPLYQSPLLPIFQSRENLTRGAIDIVSGNHLLRYCRLTTAEPNQTFGFEFYSNENGHFVCNIQKNSPAERAGVNENDRLVEIDSENVEKRIKDDVAQLIRTGTQNGMLRLFVCPYDVKVLSKRSAKSMTSLNDSRHYNGTLRSRYDDSTWSSRDRSVSRHNNSHAGQSRANLFNATNFHSSEPTEPWPRKCRLDYDASFRGCGFRITERNNYDTPIVIEVAPNSPAKRSGLTDGDHIIYIDSHNVQNLQSFNHITSLIQHLFEQNGHITLTVLTDSAYRVLKRRGGYLNTTVFDYQTHSFEHSRPRFYRLHLSVYEYDFGFTFEHHEYFLIKTIDEQSSTYLAGLRKNDVILEINGQITKHLSTSDVNNIIEIGKHNERLDLLVIDLDGYQYSIKHAIPLNSLLPFVEIVEERRITPNRRLQYEPVYL